LRSHKPLLRIAVYFIATVRVLMRPIFISWELRSVEIMRARIDFLLLFWVNSRPRVLVQVMLRFIELLMGRIERLALSRVYELWWRDKIGISIV
jgi:hypothetical protein